MFVWLHTPWCRNKLNLTVKWFIIFLIKHIFLQEVSYGQSETYLHFNFGKLFERDSVLLKESGASIKKQEYWCQYAVLERGRLQFVWHKKSFKPRNQTCLKCNKEAQQFVRIHYGTCIYDISFFVIIFQL